VRQLEPAFELGFHGDRQLLELAAQLLPQAQNFIETGANVGSTLGYVARSYPHLKLYSCEPDAGAHAAASRNLAGCPNVSLRRALSPDFLYALHEEEPGLARARNFYWLDAHSYGYAWPLWDEIRFISARDAEAVIAVDDAQVPERPEFHYMRDGEQSCDLEHVCEALAAGKRYRILYPTYRERTSPHHPLIGVVFAIVGSGFTLPSPLGPFRLETLEK
jgi:hypothetical protein